MKKINIYSLLIVMSLVFSWACKKDYKAPTGEPNHLFITTSAGDFALASIIHDTVSLIDLSRGIKSRTWTFDEGTVDIIDSDNDLTSDLQVCKVAFNIPGTYDVPLHQVYGGDAYVGTSQIGSTTFDTTIRVVIFDSVHASFDMERVRDSAIWSPIAIGDTTVMYYNQIWAGRYMRLMNRSTGGGTADWYVVKSDLSFTYTASQLDTLEYKFSSMGNFHVGMHAYNPITRDDGFIGYLNLVQVIESKDPVLLDSLKGVLVDGSRDMLKLVFSRDMKTPHANLATGGYFTLTVEDYEYGAISGVTIQEAYQDENQPNVIWLKLSTAIMNTDFVRLSYEPNMGNAESDSTLITVDNMTMKPFTNRLATFDKTNIFEGMNTAFDWNIEGPAPGDFWLAAPWGSPWNQGTFEMRDGVSDPATDGDNSLHVTLAPGGGMALGLQNADAWNNSNHVSFTMENGNWYLFYLTYKVVSTGTFIPNPADDTHAPPDLRIYMGSDAFTNPNNGELMMGIFGETFSRVGEWINAPARDVPGALKYFHYLGDTPYIHFRINNTSAEPGSGNLELYLDRIEGYVMEIR